MFAWDARKAATVFADPDALEWEDLEHSTRENRFKRLGFSAEGRIVILVYSYRRLKDGKETIRIITARRATSKERETYAR